MKGEKGAGVNPSSLRYHVEHDWARIEGDNAFFGITSYAQEALGDIVYVELPEVGAEVVRGHCICRSRVGQGRV